MNLELNLMLLTEEKHLKLYNQTKSLIMLHESHTKKNFMLVLNRRIIIVVYRVY